MEFLYQSLFKYVWLAFVLYWYISARFVKRTKTPEPVNARLTHVFLTIFSFVLCTDSQFRTGTLKWVFLPQSEISFLIGAAILFAGLGFAVWARIHLGQYWSGAVVLKEGHRLIRTGPYAIVRHPIYTGIIGGLLGTAVAIGELRGLLAVALLTATFLYKSRREERLLISEFGEEYRAFRRGRGALLPVPSNVENVLYIFGIIALSALFIYAKNNPALGKQDYRDRLKPMEAQVYELEKEGKSNRAAHQILTETRWLLNSTHDFNRVANRLADLRAAINDPALWNAPDEQSSADGSWGKWYTEWFFKLDASFDQIAELSEAGKVPQYPVRFLDEINSPEKLTAHLNALLISDFKREGIDHRREFNETTADLMRLILRGWPANYAFHSQLKTALIDFLIQKARNPETGYWGEWYQTDSGLKKTDDLSITFHIVSYLKGEVPDWPKIIGTTLANKDKEYPLGWKEDDEYRNHHNMDVVQLFRLGWGKATRAQQEQMRMEIHKMLHWCLAKSLQPDGSFAWNRGDDSLETCVAWGVSFLSRIGYFDAQNRFWTSEQFPEAGEVKQRISKFIHTHESAGGEGGGYYRDALRDLGESL